MSQSDWVSDDVIGHVLAALTLENRLAVTVSLLTGLRIGDVLNLRTEQVRKGRFTVTEEKTLKRRSVRLPTSLQERLLTIAGKVYVFENRLDAHRHRTRQAVYRDIVRARKAFRLSGHISPHTARKVYAVREFKKDFDVRRVKRLLNHSSEAVTMIYCLADELTAKASSSLNANRRLKPSRHRK